MLKITDKVLYRMKSRLAVFLAYIGIIGGLQLILFHELFHNPGASNLPLLSQVAAFHEYFVDLLAVMLAGTLLVATNIKPVRYIGYTLAWLYLCAIFVQLGAYYEGGEFLSRLALENVNHISLILRPELLAAMFLVGLLCLALPYFAEKAPSLCAENLATKFKDKHPASVLLAAIITTFVLQQSYSSEAIAAKKHYCAINNIPESSPARALVDTLFASEQPKNGLFSSIPDAISARNFGFQVDPDKEYPLLKENIYKHPPPFPLKASAAGKPNIIVFFVEGLSARTVGYYNPKFASLTPNITRFAKGPDTMAASNYYSHTAATYRGLHGQLCSLYPKYGGADGWDSGMQGKRKSSYFCLSNYLNQLGYETVFLDPHLKDAAYIDELTEHIGFKTVITAEYLSKHHLDNAEPLRNDSVSDQQLMTSLIKLLSEKETKGTSSSPFFIGIYNLETHAWRDLVKDGVSFGDGSNNVLNTIHNFDHAFGRFLAYFEKSSLSRNTILIVTADHARYPDKAYTSALESAQESFQRIFFDRIPLIVRSPFHQMPKDFDAKFSTSLDFTPSLIHFLGFPSRVANPFLGTSLFETELKNSSGIAIASIGNELYMATKDGISTKMNPGKQKKLLQEINTQIQYFKHLEENDRIYYRH